MLQGVELCFKKNPHPRQLIPEEVRGSGSERCYRGSW